MRWMFVLLSATLSACTVTVTTAPSGTGPTPDAREAARSFTEVVNAVQPAAMRECNRRTNGINCNFKIVVDPDPHAAPNAYQTVDSQGRPELTFTATLIATARNPDELAFVMGHEAAHHIAGHLARQQRLAADGAEVFAGLATLTGGNAADVAEAQELGAAVGARSYSKEFELEADELGTIITYRAGYDPMLGAQFFARIPDPGDRFLSTHPPNAARMDTVRRTSQQLGLPG